MFTKKQLPETPDQEKERLIAEITADIENKYRENFNFACLFQDIEQDGILTKYAGIFACVLVIINIIINFTR